jgi:hypothetical protein
MNITEKKLYNIVPRLLITCPEYPTTASLSGALPRLENWLEPQPGLPDG